MTETSTAMTPVTNEKELREAQFRAMANLLVDRMAFAYAAGFQFDRSRDLYEAFGYARRISPQEYRDRYERGGIAQRLVNAFPHSTWRGGGEVIEVDDPETETDFEKAFFQLNVEFGLWEMFKRVDILAQLGRYGVILIGGPGDYNTPLKTISTADRKQLYFSIFSESNALIQTVEIDKHNPRFGQPTFYQITHKGADGKTNQLSSVHYSRIIHIPAEGELDEQGFGLPKLKAVWNLLDDLEKVHGGGSEAFFKRVDGGKHIKMDPNMPMPSTAELEELNAQLDEYTHKNKRILKTRGIDIEDLGTQVSTFGPNIDSLLDLIAATSGIPQRILMGSERGELASSTDQSNYDDRVEDRRKDYAEVKILRPFVLRMIELSVLPMPGAVEDEGEDFSTAWPEEENMDESQRMAVAKDAAEINQKAGQPVILISEIRDNILGLPPIEEVASDDEMLLIEEANLPSLEKERQRAEMQSEFRNDDELMRAASRHKKKSVRMKRLSKKGRAELRRKKRRYW